jgi:hypothetical protein
MKIDLTYEKIYTDDVGKHTLDVFNSYIPECVSYVRLWGGAVDGFCKCKNSDIVLTSTEGSIRLVIATKESDNKYKFEEYYLSGLDGKIVKIPKNTLYGIQNMENNSSSYLLGSNVDKLDFDHISNKIFNWRKKRP